MRTVGDTGIVHVLGRRTTIGRIPSNDLCIDTEFVSRHHAVVLVTDSGTVVEDLNSTNGVFVNDVRVTRQELREGDVLTIGTTSFRYVRQAGRQSGLGRLNFRARAAPASTGSTRERQGSLKLRSMSEDYLQRILQAKVYEVAIESPLDLAPRLSRRLGHEVRLKREDLQPVFSFKLRGAYNKIAQLGAAAARGVITASAGNHAQGVALAAQRRQVRALIVMPQTTPAIKVQAVADLGGEVVLHGDVFDTAYRARHGTGARAEPELCPSLR